MRKLLQSALFILVMAVFVTSCASSRHRGYAPLPGKFVKDNKPIVWSGNHPRVMKFVEYYRSTTTVEKALERSRSYLPRILPEFKKRRLPLQLAYLPMLESLFDPRADSGHARGMWQFTPQTAEEMGLHIGRFTDDRINVRKATRAAAEYLERLGEKFNYNWALALAAYNGGPNYVAKAMRKQHTWDFWRLRLRRETAEYVPRFLAMLRVAQEKYSHLMIAKLDTRQKARRYGARTKKKRVG